MPELAEIARVPGTVCYLPTQRQKHVSDRSQYVQERVEDLCSGLDSLLLDPSKCRRVVWIEARGQVKSFHPAIDIATIRAAAVEITLSEYGLSRTRSYQAFRQGVLAV